MSGILIVTGGSRGIGAATARLAATRGYDVAINYRSGRQEAEAVAKDASRAGVRAITVQGDVAKEADVVRLFETVDRELGGLTALVNNAGVVGAYGRVVDIDAASLQSVFNINCIGGFLCAREAIRRMSTDRDGKGGGIVNVSSRAAELGNANTWVWYAASKGAVDTFTVGLAREVGREGIRVNAVAPGLIDTEIHEPAGGRERVAKLLAEVPMGRVGTPDEVAECILWLLSDQASYVTGTIVEVGGGR
jgi:NAD(P)-dependent dehydrogenase (short-subunit alcohol dehydrogenase family)